MMNAVPLEARVELKLDGKPIHVSIIDGKFTSFAHMFRAFDSVDDVGDALLARRPDVDAPWSPL
jgi:hypothetical protein